VYSLIFFVYSSSIGWFGLRPGLAFARSVSVRSSRASAEPRLGRRSLLGGDYQRERRDDQAGEKAFPGGVTLHGQPHEKAVLRV
jgi:hypothetical protein